MRATALLSGLVLGLFVVGCTVESTPAPTTSKKKPTSTTPVDNDTAGTGNNDGTVTPPPAGDVLQSGTWANGFKLDKPVTIAAGATIEIADGAQITAASGAAITVQGTLHLKATTHAKISGTGWLGITVAKGGTIDVDGLDIADAATSITTLAGNTDAKVANATLTGATPFKMEAGSKLTVSHVNVTAQNASSIAGTFNASFMTYDKGTAEGLQIDDAAGSMIISDSTLKGQGGGDFVVSRNATEVSVTYSTITGAHCGFHFDNVGKYTIDHVSDDTNSYGTMLYGSGAGPHTISYSNFRSSDHDLDMQNTNGPTKIDHTYTGGKDTLQNTATVTNKASSPIADAKPRG